MQRKLLVILSCVPLLGACSSTSFGSSTELSENQISEINGYKCMIREGLMSKDKALELIQKEAQENKAYYSPVLVAMTDGVSGSDYARSEAQISKSGGCKNVALAWMSVNLGTEKTAKIVAELNSKGWFDGPRKN